MTDSIIGIDPGFSGAIAIIEDDTLCIFDMPVLEYKVSKKKNRKEVNLAQISKIINKPHNPMTFIEALAGMPGMGGTQMFTFGQAYGMTKACLALNNCPYILVSPQKWKKHFNLTKDKNKARELAQKIFPNKAHMFSRKKDDGRAEAALIADYGRQCLNRKD